MIEDHFIFGSALTTMHTAAVVWNVRIATSVTAS